MNQKLLKICRCFFRPQAANQKGQSTVEYVVIVSLLLAVFLGSDSMDKLIKKFHQKYKSYAFSVAISDPPSSSFDKEVNDGAQEIADIVHLIKEIMQFIEGSDPDAGGAGDNPATEELEEFENIIKNL